MAGLDGAAGSSAASFYAGHEQVEVEFQPSCGSRPGDVMDEASPGRVVEALWDSTPCELR